MSAIMKMRKQYFCLTYDILASDNHERHFQINNQRKSDI